MSHLFFLAFLALTPPFGADQQPTSHQSLTVTATRVPEEVGAIPVAMTIITAQDLAGMNAEDLSDALSGVAGVMAASGGDGGPAGSVPEFNGLREYDAFLLVIDGVPWGGAFNPALTSVSLNNVERIEVLRGPAPVTYGATSFVGVIHIIHNTPGSGQNQVRVQGGSYESGGASLVYQLPALGSARQSLTLDTNRQGFEDDRTQSEKGHLLYRLAMPLADGSLNIDTDLHFLRQDPASPHPRQGTSLSELVERDNNYNPAGAQLDQDRLHLALSYEKPLAGGSLGSVFSLTHTSQDNLRGFLIDLEDTPRNAAGYQQKVTIQDLYFDVHWGRQYGQTHLLMGFDYLAGKGEQASSNYRYTVPLDGRNAPRLSDGTLLETTEMEDERGFGGLFLQTEWTPNDRLRIDAGARLNMTHEKREGEAEPFGEEDEGEEDEGEEEGGEASKSINRLGGVLGFSYQLLHSDQRDLWVFADYRNTFKPAALDFGPEAEAEILDPETAVSYELGLKWSGSNAEIQISAFSQDFENLVINQNVNGFPQLVNAGTERFEGAEIEARQNLKNNLRWGMHYSWHDARFRDYERLFDGVPFQLEGKRLELSAQHLGGANLVYGANNGFGGQVKLDYVGSRYLDKRNRAKAKDYSLWSAAVTYRHADWELRLEGHNLSNRRDPIAESELGDAQYYLQPARSLQLSWSSRF